MAEGYGSLPGTVSGNAPLADAEDIAADATGNYQGNVVEDIDLYEPYGGPAESAPLSPQRMQPAQLNQPQSSRLVPSTAQQNNGGRGANLPATARTTSSGFGGVADGNLRWLLLALVATAFLFGNWSNNEPVVRLERSGSTALSERRADWAGLPSSYYFSLYFFLLLGVATLLTRVPATALLLCIISVLSVLQDWVLFSIYWPAMSTQLSADRQTSNSNALLNFTKLCLIVTHVVKVAVVATAAWIFYRRGGYVAVPGLKNSYDRLTGRSGGTLY